MKNHLLPALLALCALLTIAAVSLFKTAASAHGDAFSALIRAQTDAFSAASDRSDQAMMGRMLDNEALFSNGSGTVYSPRAFRNGTDEVVRDEPGSISTFIKRQTQAFQDAGQRGDMATVKRYLDSNVLYVNENGRSSVWSDFLGSAPAAAPKGIVSTVTVKEWVLHRSGDVAASTFIADQLSHYGKNVLHEQFRTVETWIKRGAAWKLIGSETIPLYQDGSAVSLPSNVLNDYVGTYVGVTGVPVTISRSGAALAATRDGKTAPLEAEVRDVFSTHVSAPGYASSRIIFQRNASGQVTGYISRNAAGDLPSMKIASPAPSNAPASPPPSTLTLRTFVVHHTGDVAVATFYHDRVFRYAGHVQHTTYRSSETWIKRDATWKMLASQGCAVLQDPPAVTLSTDELKDYVGTYALAPGFAVTISRAGNALAASTNGAKAVPLEAEFRDLFFTPGSPHTRLIFQRDAGGHITRYLSRRDGLDLVFTKVATHTQDDKAGTLLRNW